MALSGRVHLTAIWWAGWEPPPSEFDIEIPMTEIPFFTNKCTHAKHTHKFCSTKFHTTKCRCHQPMLLGFIAVTEHIRHRQSLFIFALQSSEFTTAYCMKECIWRNNEFQNPSHSFAPSHKANWTPMSNLNAPHREVRYGEVDCSANKSWIKAAEKIYPSLMQLLAGVCFRAVCEFQQRTTKQPH